MHIEPASRRWEFESETVACALELIEISGSAPAERAKLTFSATISPYPDTVSNGEPSTSWVPESCILEPTIPSRSNPPHLAPNPVDEIVAEPASKTPCTSMVACDAMRSSTPSLTVILVVDAIVKSPSRRYGLQDFSSTSHELMVPVGTVEAMNV